MHSTHSVLRSTSAAGLSMMDGLLQLATEEQDKAPAIAPLGSLQGRQPAQHSLLGSMLDSVHSKVAAELTAGGGGHASDGAPGEQTALSLVQGVVAEAIEDSCRDTLYKQAAAEPAVTQNNKQPADNTALGSLNGTAPALPSVSSC
eukprot:TRINITY_DN7641_c0_g1_i10.p2 TRINITY_DN7641_c0_g1~~TRINITY_DN7641_c0_g1_i10.p2  ORF type:complete len:146 (+),score=50.71 TRINITY_DN7641_c0_g1_i10:388-825(+)